MADAPKIYTPLAEAVNDLRKTSQDATYAMHANLARQRPVDAWAAMGEAYPGAPVSPSAAALASVPASTQTIATEPAKKSMSYVTVAAIKAQAPGMSEPLYKAESAEDLKKSFGAVAESNQRSLDTLVVTQPRSLNNPSAKSPWDADYYTSESK